MSQRTNQNIKQHKLSLKRTPAPFSRKKASQILRRISKPENTDYISVPSRKLKKKGVHGVHGHKY